jgi:hypothetical protein
LHMRVGLERHDVVAIAANVNNFYQQLALASLNYRTTCNPHSSCSHPIVCLDLFGKKTGKQFISMNQRYNLLLLRYFVIYLHLKGSQLV